MTFLGPFRLRDEQTKDRLDMRQLATNTKIDGIER
jgi:hypothetical protein